jgi:hypothetical protein
LAFPFEKLVPRCKQKQTHTKPQGRNRNPPRVKRISVPSHGSRAFWRVHSAVPRQTDRRTGYGEMPGLNWPHAPHLLSAGTMPRSAIDGACEPRFGSVVLHRCALLQKERKTLPCGVSFCVRACVLRACVRFACGRGCQWATEAVLRACETSSSVPLRRPCHCRRRSPRAPAEARLVTTYARGITAQHVAT